MRIFLFLRVRAKILQISICILLNHFFFANGWAWVGLGGVCIYSCFREYANLRNEAGKCLFAKNLNFVPFFQITFGNFKANIYLLISVNLNIFGDYFRNIFARPPIALGLGRERGWGNIIIINKKNNMHFLIMCVFVCPAESNLF